MSNKVSLHRTKLIPIITYALIINFMLFFSTMVRKLNPIYKVLINSQNQVICEWKKLKPAHKPHFTFQLNT